MELINEYDRLLKNKIKDLLNGIGGLVIKGPSGAGKNYLAKQFAKTVFDIQEKTEQKKLLLELNQGKKFFSFQEFDKPILISNWDLIPQIWDQVRILIDQSYGRVGLYILTNSNQPDYSKINHNGAGRIYEIKIRTLTFAELLNDQPKISLKDLFKQKIIKFIGSIYEINSIASMLLIGGWPYLKTFSKPSTKRINDYLNKKIKQFSKNILRSKISSALTHDLFNSLLKFVDQPINKTKLLKLINNQIDPKTLFKYIHDLESKYVIFYLESWNRIKKIRLKRAKKLYLCDSSIGLKSLNIQSESQLLEDLQIFEIYFKNQVIKDLMVYADLLESQLFFYETSNGLSIDLIMESKNETWAAIEICLGGNQVTKAANKLKHFAKQIGKNEKQLKKPEFLLIITAENFSYRLDDNIFVIPHTCLKN